MTLVSAVADPPVFIFRDSTIDVRTNNYIASRARANFPYNRINFPYSQATGRFSNGYNIADEIDPSTLLQGVNFASAGAGILDATGFQTYGDVISMIQQVQQFAIVRGNITQLLGQDKSAEFIAKTLFVISELVIRFVQLHMLTTLPINGMGIPGFVQLGSLEFRIVSIPQIGCRPSARLLNSTTSGLGCLMELNNYAQAFYSTILALLKKLSSELQGMMYSLGDAKTMTSIVMEPETFCEHRAYAEKPCYISESPNLRPNCSVYLFWDLYHPTHYAAHLAAITPFTGT
ncbi:hypothetical protein EUGRSUZ_I02286 [Eucalyptus grandis]|uniref:Uncharacterized protein n=2 Tax=Eucalyptus grandis TaxID=71139 RepID=A0ACC3JIL9_EUCGR|nr:hypothetical protein EUGRSUZ_I02286 [Eucalyptus grandis]